MNRALLLVYIAKGKSKLLNVLFSDDTRHFMSCLQALGYKLEIDEDNKSVYVFGGEPSLNATINVGSAGTAARFLTAFLAHFKGEYVIDASEQMKARPMKPLLDALKNLNVQIEFLGKEGYLPIKTLGSSFEEGEIELAAEQSSQFLSTLLLSGNLTEQLKIKPKGKEIAKSYIDITLKMINTFGGNVSFENDEYI